MAKEVYFPLLKKRDGEGFRLRKNKDEQEHLLGMFNVSCLSETSTPKDLQELSVDLAVGAADGMIHITFLKN